ncbi:cysteine-rich repeat secretory protein 38-like isoform X2 [Mercurialis annua]|uniref:cysteine-rich repeat secretory protein 38-like isoform X2 n=1 Tax=Mercurialis annua TaxID=3986 RepID=UPI00215DF71B|nr:cysteine-rich repeat secretory protein 38-like isoform X2 [Mercurialis annua]
MDFSSLMFLFHFTFIQLVFLTLAQPDPLFSFCAETGNFTSNSTYKSNLDRLFTTLSSNVKTTNKGGFYSDSYGQNTDKVNTIALCRGDKTPDTCRSCINNATLGLTQSCPNQKEAITWYDDCMLRYSGRSILGNMEFRPAAFMFNINNVSDVNEFNQVLNVLLDDLKNSTASGDSVRKFAANNAVVNNNQTLYALTQCTPDLSKRDCNDCLNNATALIPQYLYGKQGGRVITPSCQFRYEIEQFYDSGIMSPSPSPSPPTSPSPQPPPSGSGSPTAPVPLLTPPPSSQTATPQPNNNAASIAGRRSNTAMAFIFCVLLVSL